nr:efflux RND transporter permease subunit [Marinicella sp. W31]MDC2875989.1 efflux RND transporter permease subunit [Marinicella sp. W31]
MARFYAVTLRWALAAPLVLLSLAGLLMFGAYLAYANLTTELLPREDRSLLLMRVSAPQGVSLDYTRDRIQQVEERLQPLIDSGEVESVFSISGFGNNTNSGFVVMTLAPWSERTRTQDEISRDVNAAAGGSRCARLRLPAQFAEYSRRRKRTERGACGLKP